MNEQHQGAHAIAGQWLEGESGERFDITSPNDGEHVGSAPAGGASECRAAIAAAREAFETSIWPHAPRLRAQVLLQQAARLEASASELAPLLARETGKLIAGAEGEVAACVSELRYYAGLARAIEGRVTNSEPGVQSLLHREPAGVVGIITPWNAPGTLLIRSLAPALAAGCTAVLKPAPQSCLFHTALLRCLLAADDLPRGVINSFCESGSAGAQEMVASCDVDVISFTGSSAVGKAIMAAAAPTLKRLNLELGGKASGLVFEDCDPQVIAPRLAAGGMILCGQQCTALNRVLVHESKYDQMKQALAAALKNMAVGDSLDRANQIGPLIDMPNRDRIRACVEEHRDTAALVGTVPDGLSRAGAFIAPSLLTVTDLESPALQEEFFGPIMNIEPFASEEEAIARANATRYGLAASVWTGDLNRAHRVARALRSGTVWLNDHNKLFPEAETGGYRESGFGRLHGPDGMLEFLSSKQVYHSIHTAVR